MLAATVVSHGELCATVLAPGPLLPADAATKTPASAANMKLISTGSLTSSVAPENDRLMTSTPSDTASLMAATMSAVVALAVPSALFQPIL